ncbi:MarR family winged helix-turn-helix transcriptional regulator [Ktedonosporobacter rubrisoli]|nr:MarR family transcriptional regulator [Ktedonosporobacter rubrisoli]
MKPLEQLLLDLFRELGLHQPARILPGWSLSLSEFLALNVLASRAPLSQRELGCELSLEKSTISRLVDQLEQRGWITPMRDLQDNRLCLLYLSEQGQSIALQLQQRLHEHYQGLFSQLGPGERQALTNGLAALFKLLEPA